MEKINKAFIMTIFIIVSLFVLYPLVYVVSAAFSPGTGIASVNIVPFGDGFTAKHFIRLFTETS
ncbi:MAG TPA: sugar ABC transporter permease, partial [Treponemataceae bacterium]|nr:sugar ABC transporter permease [Treponemataceae bacterium]